MADFFIYAQRPRQDYRPWPLNWRLVAVVPDEVLAVELAKGLCSKRYAVDTEPSRELKHAFFGSVGADNWHAMITTTNIHQSERIAS